MRDNVSVFGRPIVLTNAPAWRLRFHDVEHVHVGDRERTHAQPGQCQQVAAANAAHARDRHPARAQRVLLFGCQPAYVASERLVIAKPTRSDVQILARREQGMFSASTSCIRQKADLPAREVIELKQPPTVVAAASNETAEPLAGQNHAPNTVSCQRLIVRNLTDFTRHAETSCVVTDLRWV